MPQSITIFGAGNLGGALAAGLKDSGHALTVCDRNPAKLAVHGGYAALDTSFGAKASSSEINVLCVKPKHTVEILDSLTSGLRPGALVISCAAGVSLAVLARAAQVRVCRAMPNIGAASGQSTTAVCMGPACRPEQDLARVHAVFDAVGTVRIVHDEDLLHAITAIAASGPAFLLLAIEAMLDAGVHLGLARTEALAFAAGACRAAAARLISGIEPAALRAEVTSPGGTTAAGLAVLEKAAVRAAFADAVAAATDRSRGRGRDTDA